MKAHGGGPRVPGSGPRVPVVLEYLGTKLMEYNRAEFGHARWRSGHRGGL